MLVQPTTLTIEPIGINKNAEALAQRNTDSLLWGIRKSGCTVAVKQILIKQAIKKLLDEL